MRRSIPSLGKHWAPVLLSMPLLMAAAPQASGDVPDFVLFLGRFHPMVLHFPIGLLLLAAFMELLVRFRSAEHLKPSIPLVLGLGAASAFITSIAGLLLSLGNITLPPEKLAPAIAAYREAGTAAGHAAKLQVGVAKHLYLARDSQTARDEFYPRYAGYLRSHSTSQYNRIEVTREVFEERAAPGGALYVGSPQEIIDKIGREREIFGHDRLLVQIDIGGLPFDKLAGAIDLYATEVAPKFR